MTVAEINSLRKSGQLQEALAAVEQLRSEQPRDYNVAVCAAWVYVDMLKQNATYSRRDIFAQYLQKISDLRFSERESILFDNVLWATRKLLDDYAKTQQCDTSWLECIPNILSEMPISTRSDAYRGVLMAATKIVDWAEFEAFVQWWDLKNLRAEDYQKREYNGEYYMSLAESTYNALCRCMFMDANTDKIEAFLPDLDDTIASHSEYQYLPYYKAKLLFKIDKSEEAKEALKPFARKNSSAFWVWQLLGDESDDDAQKMMFYIKAASCSSPDEMLVRMREHVGSYLITKGKLKMGKYLIEKVIATRQKENRRPSYSIQELTRQPWWAATPSLWDKSFAEEQSLLADEFLFGKMQHAEVLVIHVNIDKRAISFITENRQEGFFFIKKGKLPKVNDVVEITGTTIATKAPTNVLRWQYAGNRNNPHFYKHYTGTTRKNTKGFAFVDDVFVHDQLMTNIPDRVQVDGTAIISYDKKKHKWGWKAITINQLQA